MEGKNVNVKNMIIMGLIGAIIGLFAGAAVAGFFPKMEFLFLVVWGVIIILFAFWGAKMKEATDVKTLPQDGLTKKEQRIAWTFSLINPVITGGVLYFMWSRTYPIKAKQANHISFVAFFLWIALYFFYFWFKLSVNQ